MQVKVLANLAEKQVSKTSGDMVTKLTPVLMILESHEMAALYIPSDDIQCKHSQQGSPTDGLPSCTQGTASATAVQASEVTPQPPDPCNIFPWQTNEGFYRKMMDRKMDLLLAWGMEHLGGVLYLQPPPGLPVTAPRFYKEPCLINLNGLPIDQVARGKSVL